MHSLGSRSVSANLVAGAALAAAIALLLASPASAGQMTHRQLPASARFAAAQGRTMGAADIFRALRKKARKATKTAHFNFPYGMTADAFGNVYVANYNNSTVSVINDKEKATAGFITSGLSSPISASIDPNGNLFVGSTAGGGGGYVTKFFGNTPVQTITANANYPFSIAVDEFDDLYIAGSGGGISLDDPTGSSLFTAEYAGYGIISVAVGNGSVYGFVNNNYLYGNGSYLLRTDSLQSIVGPSGAVNPVGVACGSGLCWYSDNSNNTIWVNNGVNTNDIAVAYDPAGVAYDQVHNRLFVADPLNNAVHVYNAQTLAAEKTII